jgi:hypothetical protein
LPVAPEVVGEERGDVRPGVDQECAVHMSEQLLLVTVLKEPHVRWWCLMSGLDQDPATFLHPSVAPDPAASDPRAKAARSDEAAAAADFDTANAKLIDAVAAQQSFELRARSGPALYAADLTPVLPDRDTGEERRLRDIEAEARADRDTASNRLIKARQAASAAVAAARHRGRT